MRRKLIAALACRNKGTRLYGKPLQNLSIEENLTILDNIIFGLKKLKCLEGIVLGVSDGIENKVFTEIALRHKIEQISGDETDVLSRLIKCCNKASGTDILRITSESPFPFLNSVGEAWLSHVKHSAQATFLDNVIDGCGFEIISLDALLISHSKGTERHRSELCSLYIRENEHEFNVRKLTPPEKLKRMDLRLTVDYPEDLVVCRQVYNNFREQAPILDLEQVVDFLDSRPDLKSLITPFVEDGYATMYL